MARIAGVDIPRDKRTVIALTYIFGVGPTTAQQITAATRAETDAVGRRGAHSADVRTDAGG